MVPKDATVSYALHNLARAQGDALAANNLAQLEQDMGRAQLARAQDLSRRMNVPGKLLAEIERYVVYVRPALFGRPAKGSKPVAKADASLDTSADSSKAVKGKAAKPAKVAKADASEPKATDPKAAKMKAAASKAMVELSSQLNAIVTGD